MAMKETLVPARIDVSESVLDDLRSRLRATRWPDELSDARGVWGPRLDRMRSLCDYWAEGYDWRLTEARLNDWPQFETNIDGQKIHFFWIRSSHSGSIPLLLTHGWPGSVAEFIDIIDPLVEPGQHGARGQPAFDLVVPSLPGYGFSGPTVESGWDLWRVAGAWRELMRRLGYARYAAQGGDFGSMVSARLALLAPDEMIGLHLNMALVPPRQGPLSSQEEADLADVKDFVKFGSAYQVIHGRSPQTAGYALTDSPAGLAAWIVDKFDLWTDTTGDALQAVSRDRLLDNIMVYWVTGTINSSMRMYAEAMKRGDLGATRDKVIVPTGLAVFPREMFRYPRVWVEQAFNLVHHTHMPRGGHFAAMEAPEALVADVRVFFGNITRQGCAA